MKTKQLSKQETLDLIELTKKRIDFNNRLNKTVRSFMKKNNITNFNGYHDTATPEMFATLKDMLDKEDWMSISLKKRYIEDTGAIFGGVYSIAVNTYHRIDLKDLEAHLKEIESATETSEESYDEFGFKVERDVEDTRMNLFFDYVPESGVRELLKRNGFKWSPNRSAWTRQLTSNAESSLRILLKQLAEYYGTEN